MAQQSKEAPGDLALVRAFVNTRTSTRGSTTGDAGRARPRGSRSSGLLPEGATARPADVRRAALFREALRDAAAGNNDGHSMPTRPARALNDVAARARLRLHVDEDGAARLEAEGTTVDAALGRLLVIVYRSMENDTWKRLKACRDDTCQWAFYDQSKNRSGHWCSMEVCGARHKAQQYRARQKTTQVT